MILDIIKDINWFMVVLWASIFILTLIVEVRTFNLTTIWFCISAFVSLILAVFIVPPAIQVVVFIVLSIILLLITKPLANKVTKNEIVKTNMDRIIGQVGIVTQEITPDEFGEVRVLGNLWRAVNYDNLTFSEGEKVLIEGIAGVKVIVSKITEQSSVKLINK